MLSKSEGLCSTEFRPLLLDASEPAFTSVRMSFVIHLDVVLGVASIFVVSEERAVASIQNVDFWIGQLWILVSVARTVLLTKMFCPILY